MNEDQSLRIVRNTLRLENLGADIAAPIQRELTRVLQEVSKLVEDLDDQQKAFLAARDAGLPLPKPSSLFRETRWRTVLAQLRVMLQPINDEFYDLLVRELAAEIPRQVKEAERVLLDAGTVPYQTAEEVLPPGASTAGGPGPALTRTQLYRVAQETKVLNRPLQRLFESETANPPASPPASQLRGGPFIESQIRNIDRVVKRGFLLGETNQEIAKNLIGEGAARSRREAETLARTAVMQMSSDAHQAFWDANSSVIAGWEYDALLDYRACPLCAPWDGRTAKERKDLPATPQHPNCRCSVLPLTETELELRKDEGPQRRTIIELVPYDGPDSKPKETDTQRVYARPVTVDGKRYWRRATDIRQKGHPLTHGEFLDRTSDVNLRQTLGSQKRADRFRELVAAGTSPDAALVKVTKVLRDPNVPGISARKRTRGLPAMGKSAGARQRPQVRDLGGLRRR